MILNSGLPERNEKKIIKSVATDGNEGKARKKT